MKNFKSIINSNKFKHGTMATILTALFIAVIIVVNLVVAAFAEKFPSINIDLTEQKLNSLSEEAVEVAKDAKVDTTIYFIGTEEKVKSNAYYSSYGFQYSQVASLAEKMQEANSKIKVEFIDPDLNPTFISKYADYNLSEGKVFVYSELRQKVLTVSDLFESTKDENTGLVSTFTKADGALSNAVYIVNLDNVPVISVVTGHEELFNAQQRAAFNMLMEDNGFMVQEVDLLTQDISEDTQIVFLAAPSINYSDEEMEKINTFMADTTNNKSVVVASDPEQASVPAVDSFLADWGMSIGDGVIAETNFDRTVSSIPYLFLVDKSETYLVDYTYDRLVTLYSSPINFLFEANNSIVTFPVTSTSTSAFVITDAENIPENPETASYATSGMSYRINNTDNGTTYTSVYVMGDCSSLTSNFIGSSSFSNREFIIDLFQDITGTTDAGMSLYVESTETNVQDIATSYGTLTMLCFYIGTIAIPILLLIVGMVIFIRRRHL